MYKPILPILCCPQCHGDLALAAQTETEEEVLEGTLTCEHGHIYRISQGVVDFHAREQSMANQWESMGQEQDFAELDRDMDARNPEEVLQRRRMVLETIVSQVADRHCQVVLDIASGRGLLLTELTKKLSDQVHILALDLSAYVLKYDREKFKRMVPGKKITYLACDATRLPLKDHAVDAATTYCGFSNMIGVADQALREAHRVIAPKGVLLDSYVVIQKESQGYETLQQVCTAQGIMGAEDFFLQESLTRKHEDLFRKVTCNVVLEGLGIDNGMDLLPFPGEWYAEQVYCSEK